MAQTDSCKIKLQLNVLRNKELSISLGQTSTESDLHFLRIFSLLRLYELAVGLPLTGVHPLLTKHAREEVAELTA